MVAVACYSGLAWQHKSKVLLCLYANAQDSEMTRSRVIDVAEKPQRCTASSLIRAWAPATLDSGKGAELIDLHTAGWNGDQQ